MAVLKPRFPISPQLIGPWDEITRLVTDKRYLSELQARIAVAKQQAVNLNNMIEDLQDSVLSLENQSSSGSGTTSGVTDISGHSGSIYVIDEVPAGVKDGANTHFSISRTPILFILTFNGQTLINGTDYNLTNQLITYIAPKIPKATTVHHAFGLGI